MRYWQAVSLARGASPAYVASHGWVDKTRDEPHARDTGNRGQPWRDRGGGVANPPAGFSVNPQARELGIFQQAVEVGVICRPVHRKVPSLQER